MLSKKSVTLTDVYEKVDFSAGLYLEFLRYQPSKQVLRPASSLNSVDFIECVFEFCGVTAIVPAKEIDVLRKHNRLNEFMVCIRDIVTGADSVNARLVSEYVKRDAWTLLEWYNQGFATPVLTSCDLAVGNVYVLTSSNVQEIVSFLTIPF